MEQISKTEHTRICENVFELSRIAECMEIDGAIEAEDSRELFYCILDWAEEFEKQFDPHGKENYQWCIEAFADRKLRENYQQELNYESVSLNPRQALADFIRFTRDTAEVWPWFISSEEILGSPARLEDVRGAVPFDPIEGYDTDALYRALDNEFGINPELTGRQEQSW